MTREDYPRPAHHRLRRACACALGFAAVVAVGYVAFSVTAAWLAERIA